MRIWVKHTPAITVLCLSLVACSVAEQTNNLNEPARASNILIIVADDLGYADVGSYGSEIQTPQLDELAAQGTRFTNFYAAPTCSPSRVMLLTGVDSHLAGLGTMAERMAPIYKGQPGYEGYMNDRVIPISEVLQDAGYNTYMTGKWHLGHSPEANPANRGFRRSFALLDGGAFHMSQIPQADPDITGKHLASYTANGQPVNLPDDFYSSRFYARQIIEYIETDRHEDRPFFAYLAFTAPHFPLQAPDASRDKYIDTYAIGYDEIYAERLTRMQSLVVAANGIGEFPRTGEQLPWSEISPEQRAFETRRMALHAAMIDDMDRYIGELFDYLKEIGEYDNTWIMFLSDNGPEGREIDRAIRPIGSWPARCCDNRLANMGASNSYVWLGPNWGRVSAGPLRRFKGTTADGGIRVPAIIKLPKNGSGSRMSGGTTDAFASVLDIFPTLLSVSGAQHPGIRHEGRHLHLPTLGTSLQPLLRGEVTQAHPEDYWLGWELSNRRAIKQGEWKLVMDKDPFGEPDWTLHHVPSDPGEKTDLSESNPKQLEHMLSLWEKYQTDNNVILPE